MEKQIELVTIDTELQEFGSENWIVVTGTFGIFFDMPGRISSQLMNSYFSEGSYTTNQKSLCQSERDRKDLEARIASLLARLRESCDEFNAGINQGSRVSREKYQPQARMMKICWN